MVRSESHSCRVRNDMKRSLVALATALCVSLVAPVANADTFGPGALIIPMDTDYQDMGMLKAYGLVYELLRNDVPVRWCIRSGKGALGVDFTASAADFPGGQPVTAHGYRGGPWVITAAYAAKAKPLITAWKAANTTVVHEATATFTAPVARYLVVAPTIAMFADGNQKIARKYVQAAGIPDSTLSTAWLDSSPDMLDPDEVAGPTTTNHHDGGLFDEDGDPIYCQFMSMHWGVNDARAKPEVVAEVRSYLGFPTHFFAECQAVNAYENDLVNGLFLTPHGFVIGNQPNAVDFFNMGSPYAQFDGSFATTGGSEPSYSLPPGESYKAGGITMITEHNTPEGVKDIWMTGYLDGTCPPNVEVCNNLGKVSYLGGHEYDTKLPMSANPKTQGVRMFLNSMFESQCATAAGQPGLGLTKIAPATTLSNTVTFDLQYFNGGPGVALHVILRDAIPVGTTFQSATGGGTFSSGQVTWDLGNLGAGESGTVSFTVSLSGFGTYENTAKLEYHVGLNAFNFDSNTTSTVYDVDTDSDGIVDSIDICPDDYNPDQNLGTDVESCGTCGNVCTAANGAPGCVAGQCIIAGCYPGHSDCDGLYATGCEFDDTSFQTDPDNCGGCGVACSAPHASGSCAFGACSVGTCDAGWADCDGLLADGCEYATPGFQTDPMHCGTCSITCDTATQVCEAGLCGATTCAAGTADCVAPAGDCETTTTTDPANCGGCGLACAPPNATGVCAGGVCSIDTCNPTHADCNGLVSDGCELPVADFQTSMQNCGACGAVCSSAHGSSVCNAGVCTVNWCSVGFENCNNDSSDGCEYDVTDHATDPANCGACGVVCAPANGVGACAGGVCILDSCLAGFVDADADPTTGCEYACTATAVDESVCNGIDDDCDGLVDEDYLATTCGVGVCQSESVCASGSESCAPEPPAVEGPAGATCEDSIDNDCDGDTDLEDGDCVGGAAGAAGSAGTAGSAGAAGSGGAAGAAGSGGTAGSGGAAGTAGSSGGAAGTAGSGGGTAGSGGTAGTGAQAGSGASGGTGGSGSTTEDAGDQGGCSCTVPSTSGSRSAPMLLLAGLAALIARRRRSRRAS